ncbi:MAG: hypothetical protein IJQ37_07235 [Clostridia bacterium]|nr:hypothetical protein [Clostridia bacterium]
MLKFILYLLIVFALVFVLDLAVFGIIQKIKKNKSKKSYASDVLEPAARSAGSDVLEPAARSAGSDVPGVPELAAEKKGSASDDKNKS